MTNYSTFSNVVGASYAIGKQIGKGSFGIIFEGINLLNQQQVAIKLEPHRSKAPQLHNEYYTYKALIGCRKFFPCSSYSDIVRPCEWGNASAYIYTYIR